MRNTLVMNVTSRPSTNESATASSQYAAGAAKGKRRRAKTGRTMIASAGTQNHRVVAARRPSRADDDLEHRFDREERDQHVERIRARQVSDPAHGLNVLQGLARCLLPE